MIKNKFNFPLSGCGTGQAYDYGYMKKLSRTQLISTRSIHLVTSERGATVNDLQKGWGLKAYEPRCQQEIHIYPFVGLNLPPERKKQVCYQAGSQKKLGFQTQESSPSSYINGRKVTENQPWYVSALHGGWHTHTMNASLSTCFKHNEPVQALQLTNHKMHRIYLRLRVKSHHIPYKLHLKCDTSSHRLKSSNY